jgi:ATP-dependent protease ClpP protease subunit
MKILNYMANSWYNVNTSGSKSGEILLYNDIGLFGISAADFDQSYKAVENVSDLTVRINSYGGEVVVGVMIRNRLKEHKAKNKTIIIDGLAASIASDIATTPGFKAKMYRNTFLMIHPPQGGVVGTAKEMRESADTLDSIQNEIILDYKEKTKGKISYEELEALMNKSSWINAKDALRYGLIDEIIDEDSQNDEPSTSGQNKLPTKFMNVFLNYKPTSKEVNMKKCPICGKEHEGAHEMCDLCIGKFQNILNKAPDQSGQQANASQKEKAELEAAILARITTIQNHCQALCLPQEDITNFIKSGKSLDELSSEITNKLQTMNKNKPANILITADESEKFVDHQTKSIQCALGIEKDPKVITDIRKAPGARDVHGLVRACLVKEGHMSALAIVSLGPQDLYREAIRMSMSSSDLPAILSDTMNKSFEGAFEESGATFRTFVSESENPDFRKKEFVRMSGFGDIDDLPEGMGFKEGKFSDKKESVSISTKGKALSANRNMIVNNDTEALNLMPRLMGTAVYRRLNKDVYDVLTSASLLGPTMTEDNTAIFDATKHNNLIANSGAISVASLGAAERKLMETPALLATPDQKSKMFLNLPAKYLVAGTSNRMAAIQLFGSPIDPDATNGKQVYNPFSNGQIVSVFDPYLQYLLTTANKAGAFYLLTGQNNQPNITVTYLSGNKAPTLRSAPSEVGEALGIKWDIFFDWGVSFQDWRGIVYSDGVTAG